MTELRKCSFCGGEARTWEDFDGWRLYCTKCDATFRGGTEEELIEAWNKRVSCDTCAMYYPDDGCMAGLADGEVKP